MKTSGELTAAGKAHHRAGNLPQAEAAYRAALRLDPRNPDALHLLGLLAHQSGHSGDALKLIGAAISLRPNTPEYHNNLGIACRAIGSVEEALRSYQRAIQLNPNYADAHYNLGNALKLLGHPEQALSCFQTAEKLQPGCADIATNLGAALKELGRLDDALACYETALTRQPKYPEARWNRGIVRLLQGRYREGWEDYEWRWQVKGMLPPQRQFSQPTWNGEDLSGRTILLHAEQGFGDTIQFVRYASVLAQRGARVYVECQPALKSLLQGVAGAELVCEPGEELLHFDVQAPMLSLPRLCGTTLETIPNCVPYLHAPVEPLINLPAPPGTQLKVGIVWGGNPANDADRERSIPLKDLLPLLAISRVAFYSLQCGAHSNELASLPATVRVCDLSGNLGDFKATAAVIEQMDLVISVCTSVAHLAGAMGKPVWTLLSFTACWRWLLEREDSPWYPSMRLFRQPARGDWKSVVTNVTCALKRRIDSTNSDPLTSSLLRGN